MQYQTYRFGPYRLDTKKQVLWRDERPIQISSREFETLYALAKREGEPVDRESLIEEIWSDANISDGHNNLSKQIGSLRKKLGKDDSGQDFIRTIPSKGYFIVAEAISPEVEVTPPKAVRHPELLAIVVASIFLTVLGGFFLWRLLPRQSGRLSIAVLQFRDHQIQHESAPLAAIVTEMIRTEFAAGRGLRVSSGEETARMIADIRVPLTDSLARSSLDRIRQYLSADYVVNGSVTQGIVSNEIRVDIEIQDTRTGETVGSESAVGKTDALFDVVARCGLLLRNRLGVGELASSDLEALRGELPASTEATRLYVEGLARMRSFEPLNAKDRFAAALHEDPKSALIHSALAEAWSTLGFEQKAKAEGRRAFELSKNLTRENQLLVEGRYREFAREGQRAIEVYQALSTYFPENLEYGLRLVRSRIKFGKEAEAATTIARLRKMQSPYGDDPRIDLVQAEAAENRGDFKEELAAANQALRKAALRRNRYLIAKAQLKACWALDYLGDRDKALQLAKEAQKTFAALGDKGDEALATKNIADVLDDGGHHAAAIPVYAQAIEQFKMAGSMTGLAVTLNNMGYAIKDRGDLDQAQNSFEESARVCREIGDPGREAQALNGLAGVLKRKGRLIEAGTIYEEQLRRMEQTDQLDRAATVLNNLAEILQLRGRLSDAQKRFEQSLDTTKRNGDRTAQARTLGNLGELFLLRGDLVAAQKNFEAQVEIGTAIKEDKQRGYALQGLGRVYYERNDLDRARKFLQQALAIRQGAGEKDLVAETRLLLSELNPIRAELRDLEAHFGSAGRRDEQMEAQIALLRCSLNAAPLNKLDAREIASKLEKVLPQLENVSVSLAARTVLAEYNAAQGRTRIAIEQLREVFRIASEGGFLVQQLEAGLRLSQLLQISSEKDSLLKEVRRRAENNGLIRIAKEAEKGR